VDVHRLVDGFWYHSRNEESIRQRIVGKPNHLVTLFIYKDVEKQVCFLTRFILLHEDLKWLRIDHRSYILILNVEVVNI
jgi:hypothetical protein